MHEYFRKLIEFDTTSVVGKDTIACLDWLEEFFSDHFMYVHRVEHNGFESLIATTKPTKTPKVLLQAHLDTVPTAKEHLVLREEKGRYYGRGSFDMKFAIAVYLQLVQDLSEKKKLPEHDLGIMITTDEEVGGMDGVNALLNDGYLSKVCVLPDGGDNWCLERSAKGFYLVEASAIGKTAHGSRPWEGKNAIESILQFIETVRALFGENNLTSNTLTISTIAGGGAMNQVPDSATAQLDIRTKDMKSHEEIATAIKNAAALHSVHINMKLQGVPATANMDNKYVKQFVESVENVRNTVVKTCSSLGSSDARFFAERNIPTIVMRPRGGGAHSDEEWTRIEDLEAYLKILTLFVSSSC